MPTWQYLSGLEHFEHHWPCDPTAIGKFRRLLGEEGVEELLAQTINVAVTSSSSPEKIWRRSSSTARCSRRRWRKCGPECCFRADTVCPPCIGPFNCKGDGSACQRLAGTVRPRVREPSVSQMLALLRVRLLLDVSMVPEFQAHLMVYDPDAIMRWLPQLRKHREELVRGATFA